MELEGGIPSSILPPSAWDGLGILRLGRSYVAYVNDRCSEICTHESREKRKNSAGLFFVTFFSFGMAPFFLFFPFFFDFQIGG